MTFSEMLVRTHPNADIGYIIIDKKYHRLFTNSRHAPSAESHYWLGEGNIIYNCGSAFATLQEATFTNLPTIFDRISFTAKSLSSEELYCGAFYL